MLPNLRWQSGLGLEASPPEVIAVVKSALGGAFKI
jgi:hypothetical protein